MSKKKISPTEETMTSDEQATDGNSEMPEAVPEAGPEPTPEAGPETAPEDAAEEQASAEELPAEAASSPDIDDVENDIAVMNDRHLRLVAEFTNYRRRAEKELSEAWARGQADMLRSFVDGLDDLQRVGAWQAESTTVEALVEGVDLVERKFRQALEVAGVEMIDPVGEPFDPNIMEAMLGVPTQDPEEDEKVQDVFQKGYRFKGHLVRPARVTVFKHE
jgi:molecular chaperone GrpE